LEKPTVWNELIERNFGVMTGKLIKDIPELCSPNILKTPQLITYFLEMEGAETFPDMIERAKKVLAKVKALHPDGSVLLATHGDFGKMLYAAYYNLDWKDVLMMFHFGNSELLLLSEDSGPGDTHVFKTEQHNH
jgi:broad specificity phosphatase PhoE